MKKITLRDFVRLCADKGANSFVFATQNQKNPLEFGFGCTFFFSTLKAMPEQNIIVFSDTGISNFYISNVIRVEIRKTIPGCGTPIDIVTKRFSGDSDHEKAYTFVVS